MSGATEGNKILVMFDLLWTFMSFKGTFKVNNFIYLFLNVLGYLKQHKEYIWVMDYIAMCFPSGSDSKEFASNARDAGSILGLGISPGEGNGYLV